MAAVYDTDQTSIVLLILNMTLIETERYKSMICTISQIISTIFFAGVLPQSKR